MAQIEFKTKEEKENLSDCVVYLLQHCETFEKSDTERKFCLDVAQKALFLYNLSPKSFGRNKKERQVCLDAINEKISKYSANKLFHT